MQTSHNFLAHTDADRQSMLETIGLKDAKGLFADIPASLREQIHYDHLPETGLSELELQQVQSDWASRNKAAGMACFLGGGAYARHIPTAVNTIAGRSEFYTAYTPYQPEIAQGTLQVTYEFQTMICELTGMDVANASVYDGASAVTEAALMAVRAKKRASILVANSLHPDYRAVLQSYTANLEGVHTVALDPEVRIETLNDLQTRDSVACVIVQVPDFFGNLPNLKTIRDFCAQSGALLIVSADPASLGLLQAPGSYGADIVTGDIQALGNNLSYGGPYGGYVATRSQYLRQLPGRLVGKTVDKQGRPCYTLTLQTREQHIRREKATSNICTNQALNVLKATVYMTLTGPAGLKSIATISAQRAHWLATQLTALNGVHLLRPDLPFCFEFAWQCPYPVAPLLELMESRGILGGIPLSPFYPEATNALLVACTEMTTVAHLQAYVKAVQDYLNMKETGLGDREPAIPTQSTKEVPC